MAIERYDPFKNVERLFKESFPALIGEDLKLDLAVDVYEEKNNVVVQMNLAGVDPENINISIEENFLTIGGVREEENEAEEKSYYSKEIRSGTFERTIRLPKAINSEKADAEYEKGVLKITIPKKKNKAGNIKVRVK